MGTHMPFKKQRPGQGVALDVREQLEGTELCFEGGDQSSTVRVRISRQAYIADMAASACCR